MLKTRVSKHVDTARLGRALARPGMDPRMWVSLAIVERVVVDQAEGVFVDVTLLPTRHRVTCRVGTEYAGNGFGMHAPLEVDDEVLVEVPSGEPNNGPVITRRLHSKSDPPPAEVVDHPDDFLLRTKSGVTARLIASGTGNMIVLADGVGQVMIGADDLTLIQGAMNGEALELLTGMTHFALGNASTEVLVKK